MSVLKPQEKEIGLEQIARLTQILETNHPRIKEIPDEDSIRIDLRTNTPPTRGEYRPEVIQIKQTRGAEEVIIISSLTERILSEDQGYGIYSSITFHQGKPIRATTRVDELDDPPSEELAVALEYLGRAIERAEELILQNPETPMVTGETNP